MGKQFFFLWKRVSASEQTGKEEEERKKIFFFFFICVYQWDISMKIVNQYGLEDNREKVEYYFVGKIVDPFEICVFDIVTTKF